MFPNFLNQSSDFCLYFSRQMFRNQYFSYYFRKLNFYGLIRSVQDNCLKFFITAEKWYFKQYKYTTKNEISQHIILSLSFFIQIDFYKYNMLHDMFIEATLWYLLWRFINSHIQDFYFMSDIHYNIIVNLKFVFATLLYFHKMIGFNS